MSSFAKSLTVAILLVGVLMSSPRAEDERLKQIRAKWQPGTPMVQEFLALYPCHNEEEACSRLPPPAVQVVKFVGELKADAARGKKIATDVRWGNCVACHALPDQAGGSVGPSLADYAQRNLSLDYTYQRIWDNRLFSPNAHMPIYGTNSVLTEEEIRDIMAYIYQK
jgi:sulfur-oxidizing protein SoxX